MNTICRLILVLSSCFTPALQQPAVVPSTGSNEPQCEDGRHFGYHCTKCHCGADGNGLCNRYTGQCVNVGNNEDGCQEGRWGPGCTLFNNQSYNVELYYAGHTSMSSSGSRCLAWSQFNSPTERLVYEERDKDKAECRTLIELNRNNRYRAAGSIVCPVNNRNGEVVLSQCSVSFHQGCPDYRFGVNCIYESHCENDQGYHGDNGGPSGVCFGGVSCNPRWPNSPRYEHLVSNGLDILNKKNFKATCQCCIRDGKEYCGALCACERNCSLVNEVCDLRDGRCVRLPQFELKLEKVENNSVTFSWRNTSWLSHLFRNEGFLGIFMFNPPIGEDLSRRRLEERGSLTVGGLSSNSSYEVKLKMTSLIHEISQDSAGLSFTTCGGAWIKENFAISIDSNCESSQLVCRISATIPNSREPSTGCGDVVNYRLVITDEKNVEVVSVELSPVSIISVGSSRLDGIVVDYSSSIHHGDLSAELLVEVLDGRIRLTLKNITGFPMGYLLRFQASAINNVEQKIMASLQTVELNSKTTGETNRALVVYIVVPVVLVLAILLIVVLVLFWKRRHKPNKSLTYMGSHVGHHNTDRRISGRENTAMLHSDSSLTPSINGKAKPVSPYRNSALEQDKKRMPISEEYYNIAVVKPTTTNMAIKTFRETIVQKESSGEFLREFERLPPFSAEKASFGMLPDNLRKNRFKNTIAYDEFRVHVPPEMTEPATKSGNGDSHYMNQRVGDDYYNASWIDAYRKDDRFIACQAPKISEIATFWRMCWITKVRRIIVLGATREGDRQKLDPYWPMDDSNRVYKVGIYTITLKSYKVNSDYIVRKMTLESPEGTRDFTQYQLICWPDHQVLDTGSKLARFWRASLKNHESNKDKAIVIHCSAGVGRTGTLVAFDFLVQQARSTNAIDVFTLVSQLRLRRPMMVQTVDQYVYLHKAIHHELLFGNSRLSKEAAMAVCRSEKDRSEFKRKLSLTFPPQAPLKGLQPAANEWPRPIDRVLLLSESNRPCPAAFLASYMNPRDWILSYSPSGAENVEVLLQMLIEWQCNALVFTDARPSSLALFDALIDGQTFNGDQPIKSRFGTLETLLQRRPNDGPSGVSVFELGVVDKSDDEFSIGTVTLCLIRFDDWTTSSPVPQCDVGAYLRFALFVSSKRLTTAAPLRASSFDGRDETLEEKFPLRSIVLACADAALSTGLLATLLNLIQHADVFNDVDLCDAILRSRAVQANCLNTDEQLDYLLNCVSQHLDSNGTLRRPTKLGTS